MRNCLLSIYIIAISTAAIAAAGSGNRFEVASEKQILSIPVDCYSVGYHVNCGVLSTDGGSVVIVKAGRLTMRPLESLDEKELLPQGSVTGVLGNGAGLATQGRWIYYLQGTDQPAINDLWRLDSTTLHKERLIQNAGGVTTPAPQPSPDGKSIAFFRRHILMLANADGRNERVLCDQCDPWHSMVWSPDSSQILISLATPFPYMTGVTKLSLVTVSTGQVKPLALWKGIVSSMVWPAWSSGPFLCVKEYNPAERQFHTFWDVVFNGLPSSNSQIWHLRLPDERTQLTQESANYSVVFGAGPEGYSLVAQRMAPAPSRWAILANGFGAADHPEGAATVVLTLRK